MTTAIFLEEYSRRLARPLTGVKAETLFAAFDGFMRNDFLLFAKLRGRDQMAVIIMAEAIREKGYRPTQVTDSDLLHFKPNEGRLGNPEEWMDDDYSAYLEFVNLVASRIAI